jgi:hypothetical protein
LKLKIEAGSKGLTKRERLEKNLSKRSKDRNRQPVKEGQYVFAHNQAQVNLDGGWIIGQVSGLSGFYRVGKEGWRYAHIVKEKQVVALHRYINSALAESPIEVGVVGLLKESIVRQPDNPAT